MAHADLATEQSLRSEIDRTDHNRRQIRGWLAVVLFALFALVIVGGATRLTESGLSITEWKPIHGVIRPCRPRNGRRNSASTNAFPSMSR